jgi:outer membrane protein OmpA-like peptidoglycan-associated protein
MRALLPLLRLRCLGSAPALCLALLVVAGGIASGQERRASRLLVGLSSGYFRGSQQSDIPFYGGSDSCGAFTGGSTALLSIGGSFSLPSILDRFGVTVDLGWERSTAQFVAPSKEPLQFNDEGVEVTVEHAYHLSIVSHALRLGVLARFDPFEGATITAGPLLGYRFGLDTRQTDVRLDSFRFPGGASEQQVFDGSPLGRRPLTLGFLASAAYALPLGRRLRLVPHLSLRADLLAPVQEASWSTLSIGGGAGLQYDITPSETLPPVTPPPTPSLSPPAGPPLPPLAAMQIPQGKRLVAKVELNSLDDAGDTLPMATVHVYETLRREWFPFPDAIDFEAGSSDLQIRPSTPASRGESAADSLPMAAGSTERVLAMLGARMKEAKSARLILRGYSAADEPSWLAAVRARSIRIYLSGSWGIDTGRISIETARASGRDRSHARRVELDSDDPMLLAPIMTERIERDFDPPKLRIDPKITADAGVREWTIILSHNGRQIAHYSSAPGAESSGKSLSWQIETDASSDEHSSLVAELTVIDSAGTSATTSSRLPLAIERMPRIVERMLDRDGRIERTRWSLLAFPNKEVALSERNEAVLREVAEDVRSGARIEVTGYSDRIPGEGNDPGLARGRAERVEQRLRALLRERRSRSVTIVTRAGDSRSHPDRTLPGGRLLPGSVEIVVEQKPERAGG